MQHDKERVKRIEMALREEKLDAVICALPSNVLLLSGYWPVVGKSLSLATCDGRIFVIAPADEYDLAERGDEDRIYTFRPGSLSEIGSPTDTLRAPLREIARDLNFKRGRIGYEHGPWSQPASYAATNLYGLSLVPLLQEIFPAATLTSADEMLHRLRAVKTPHEVGRIRTACQLAGNAFAQGSASLRPGLKEFAAANHFLPPLSSLNGQTRRADGFVYCMSGANSALACRAYARSRDKVINEKDLVLVHCNSCADGYWTDITRTYHFDEPEGLQVSFYEAVVAAREATLHSIRPGARAAELDHIARETLKLFGYTKQFKHSTGHGVGFAAIDAGARPRLHPKSQDLLETGMVFNVEPALYIDGYGGLRHCDVVAVTATGFEVLTPFQTSVEDLQIDLGASVSVAPPERIDPMSVIGAPGEADASRLALPVRSSALRRVPASGGKVRRRAV